MTFISLRKPQPAPDATQTDSLEDDALEAAGPEGQDEAEDGKPVGFISALQQGVTGWFIWCANLITPRWTYTVHLVALWAACYYGALVFWGVVLGLAVAIVTFMPRDPVDRLTTRLEHVGTPGRTPPPRARPPPPNSLRRTPSWPSCGSSSRAPPGCT